MEIIKFLYCYQLLFIMPFLLVISKISSLYFAHPNAITLKNKNIFIVHKYGITICDVNFTTIIKNVTYFNPDEELDKEEDIFKVSISEFDDGYIVCIIFNKIFIIDNNGEIQINEILRINNDFYISLALDKILDYNYYYLIGYIYQNSIYLYYYKYNSLDKSMIFI